MKEFSALVPQGDDRKFELGGEVYEWVVPFWEDLAKLYDEDVAITEKALASLSAGEEGKDDAEKEKPPTTVDNVKRTQERIKLFLKAEDHKRFDALCKRKENPVPLHLWNQVWSWLLETATGRPTQQPSASEPGAGSDEQSSPAASRSRAGARRR